MSASNVAQRMQSDAPAIMPALRQATHPEHAALEAALDLLAPPFEQQRFRHLLERFYGFHVPWEAAIRREPAIAAFAAPRTRLACLRRDLAALGGGEKRLAALPMCDEAAALARTPAHAIGSLYVIEGSSLGGQVIARTMASATWLPEGGLAYFNPYGDKTGAMWRAFKEWCDAQAQTHDPAAIVEGARETFARLRVWLTS